MFFIILVIFQLQPPNVQYSNAVATLTSDLQERKRNLELCASMDTDKISCPICGKDFAASVIESHASKCLFLNESVQDETLALFKESSPIIKKNKLKVGSAKKVNQVTAKRKNSLEQSFPQRDEDDVKDITQQKSVIILFNSKKKINIDCT